MASGYGGPSFASFHQLLFRTLEAYIDTGVCPTKVTFGSLLAVLARLPIRSTSSDRFEELCRKLQGFILTYKWEEALRCDPSPHCSHFLPPAFSGSSAASSRAGENPMKESGSDSEQPVFRKRAKVTISEAAILSDSEGFPAHWSSFPPPGDIIDKDEAAFSSISNIYKCVFLCAPSSFSLLDSLYNALTMLSVISAHSSSLHPLSFVCSSLSVSSLSKRCSVGKDSLDIRCCSNWLLLIRHVVVCSIVWILSSIEGDRSSPEMCLFVVSYLKEVVLLSGRVCGSGEWIPVEEMDETVLFFLDVALFLAVQLPDRVQILTEIGETIVSWMLGSMDGSPLCSLVASRLDSRLRLSENNRRLENRVVFEVIVTLLNNAGNALSEEILHWISHLPRGMGNAVGGAELLDLLIPYITKKETVKILSYHLPRMEWVLEAQKDLDGQHQRVSQGCTRFVQLWRTTEDIHVLTSLDIIRHMNDDDRDTVIEGGVLYRLTALCSSWRLAEESPSSPSGDCPSSPSRGISSTETSSIPSPTILSIQQLIVILSSEVKSEKSAREVLRLVIRPYADALMDTPLLQEEFVLLSDRCAHLAPDELMSLHMIDWLLNRVELCIRGASVDIWTFISDSAAPFYRAMYSLLLLLRNILEDSPRSFSAYSNRILSITSSIVDLSLEWAGSPSPFSRHSYRATDMMAVALSCHLLLSKDTVDVMLRFTKAFLGAKPNSLFLSASLTSLLDRCLSREKMGRVDEKREDDEGDEEIGEDGQQRAVLHPELVLYAIKIIPSILEVNGLNENSEYALNKLFRRLQFFERESDEEVEWIPALFSVCDSLLPLSPSASLLSNALSAITRVLLRHPQPHYISRFIAYFFQLGDRSDLKLCVVERLSVLLSGRSSPLDCLVFPQVPSTQVECPPSSPVLANRTRRGSRRNILGRILNSLQSIDLDAPPKEQQNVSNVVSQSGGCLVGEAATFGEQNCSEGLSISTWVKRDSKNEHPSKELHVCSLGNEVVTCSLFMRTSNGELVISIKATEIQLKRKRIKGLRVGATWTHLVFAAKVTASNVIAQVYLGDRSSSSNVSLAVRVSDPPPLRILFGSVSRRSVPIYYLANLFVFRGVLSTAQVIFLSTLGPRLSCLVDAKVDHLWSWSPSVLSVRLLRSASSLERALGNSRLILGSLQRSLLCSVNVCMASSYGIHESSTDTRLPPQFTSVLTEHAIRWYTRIGRISLPSVYEAISPVGSMSLLLFLFVKSVNDNLSSDVQCTSLRCLFTALSSGVPSDLPYPDIVKVIVRTLSSPNAFLDEEMIQLILSYCILREEWNEEEDRKLFAKNEKSSEMIVEPRLLVSLLCSGSLWSIRRESEWRRVVHEVALLVDDAHSAVFSFNRFQLNECVTLSKLVSVCLRHISMFSYPSDSPEGSSLVSDLLVLIRSLLGSPERYESVVQLWYLVFLSHPANCTFIDQGIRGHMDWMRNEVLQEELHYDVPEDSRLCSQMKKYIRVIGRDQLVLKWNENVSLFTIRSLYESLSGDVIVNSPPSPSPDPFHPSTHRALPDLLTGLGVRKEPDPSPPSSSWVDSFRSGAIVLLSTVVQNGSDGLIQCLVHDVISWQAILILLTNQKSILVRDAVVSLLEKFLLRSELFTKMMFIEFLGFSMLASQLRGYEVSHSIADSLFGILCGETIRLGEGLDETHLAALPVDRMSCGSLKAILVVFEESVENVSLFWNVTNSLLKIFETNSQLQAAMADNGLAEVMVNVLRRIATLPESDSEVFSSDALPPQLECWVSFAHRIIISSVPYSDRRMVACCERFIWMLLVADWHAVAGLSYASRSALRAHRVIRSQLCQLLHCWMVSIQTVFSDEGRSASCASSVDSLRSTSSSSSVGDDYDYCEGFPQTSPFSAAFVVGSFASLRDKISSMGPVSRRSLRCGYPRRRGSAPLASLDCLVERILFALDCTCSVFCVHPQSADCCEEERNLFHFYLYFLIKSWTLDSKVTRVDTVWQRVMHSCRDRVRTLLAQLVAFVLFPAQQKLNHEKGRGRTEWAGSPIDEKWAKERKTQLVKALAHELLVKQNLVQLLNVHLFYGEGYEQENSLKDYESAMFLALYELVFLEDPLPPETTHDVDRIILFLKGTKLAATFDSLSAESVANLTTDEILTMHTYVEHRKTVLSQMRSKMEVLKDEESVASAKLKEQAMNATCEVVEELTTPRRMNLAITKEALLDAVHADQILTAISMELWHPQSPCFDPRTWPIGSSLDPTEGPNRERRRLTPAFYSFPSRFFQETIRNQIAHNIEVHPLENILRSETRLKNSSDEKRVFLDATILRGTFECQGELLIGENDLQFSGEKARSTQKGTECATITLCWRYDQICEIHSRNHLLKDVAIEIFLVNGDTYLVVFQSTEKRSQFKKHLEERKMGRLFPSSEQFLHTFSQSWKNGLTTNFEYLMQLNKLAGRSFNDLMQYPVFPFILSDYTSSVLDLSVPSSYRALSRPMAIQDRSMEQHYAANYACLEAECGKSPGKGISPLHFGPYHYGSHYSNSGIVVHYLVRLSPFTQIALEYQDNNFDIPDRLFNSIEATWRLASSESTTDFKELIPEFFFMHEFLVNRDKLELGTRQGGEKVGDVKLPAWIDTPRLFVLVHRQALESVMVSNNLHQWIDLIFGYKQTGSAALKALNVFHPATYVGHLDADQMKDEISQSALRTMVKSYGQMPIQLFQTPHQPSVATSTRRFVKVPGPIPSVLGLRWGDYVGSPEGDSSSLQTVLSIHTSPVVHSLHVLSDGSVVGCPRDATVLCFSSIQDHRGAPYAHRSVDSVCVMSHAFSDGVLRIRSVRPILRPWINAVVFTPLQIVSMTFSSNQLWLSFSSGEIRVFDLSLDSSSVPRLSLRSRLLAHRSKITSLSVCDQYSICVSSCVAGKAILWDANKLCFVRTLVDIDLPIQHSCISRVSADIAIASQAVGGYGSRLDLLTVNGEEIGNVETPSSITAMAMTDQPEGTAINCVAVGMENGKIRMIEMWTLSTIRELAHSCHMEAIVSLRFAATARKLFVANRNGRVLCWQNVNSVHRGKTPQFQMIDPFV